MYIGREYARASPPASPSVELTMKGEEEMTKAEIEMVDTIETVVLKAERLCVVADVLFSRYFDDPKPSENWLAMTNKFHAELLNVVLDYAVEIKETLKKVVDDVLDDGSKKAAQCTTTETAQGKTPA